MKKILVVLAVVFTFISCYQDKDRATDRFIETNSTVEYYMPINRTNTSYFNDVLNAAISDEEMMLFLNLASTDTFYSIYDCEADPYGEAATKFKGYQQKFGDFNPITSVYRYFEKKKGGGNWILQSGVCKFFCYTDIISKITVTSDHDWNKNYPAGKDLSSLFIVEFSSMSAYVNRGFTGQPVTKYRQVLSDVKPEWYNMLLEDDFNVYAGQDIILYTSTMPEDGGKHTIKVTLTLDTGETIEYTHPLDKYYYM